MGIEDRTKRTTRLVPLTYERHVSSTQQELALLPLVLHG